MPVRSALLADVLAVAELAAATFPLACPPHLSDEAVAGFVKDLLSATRFTEYLQDPQRLVLVEEAGGLLRSYAMVVLGEPCDPDVVAAVSARPTAELSKCYVASQRHGTSAAAALMAASLAAVRDRGANSMWLGTNQGNVRAITFYTKHGFTTVGRHYFTIGGHQEKDVVLKHSLVHPSQADGESRTVDHV